MFADRLGVEDSHVARKREGVDRMEEGRVSRGRNIQAPAEIEMAIVKQPVQKSGSSEQRRSLIQGCKGLENKGIRGQRGLDVVR